MATKREEIELLAAGKGCLAKAADDEPVFILRAQDKFAPALLRAWVQLADSFGAPGDKVREAHLLDNQMRMWQAMHPDRVKVPD